jgi:tellurite resistance protein TerC
VFDAQHLELWVAFWAIVVVLLGLDLAVFNRKAHAVSIKEAAIWSVVWVGLSLLFGVGIWWLLGTAPALEYLTGYVIEKSLSVDNLFVFLIIFRYFKVEPRYQHRVLFWGVFGAIVLRTIMIVAGAALVARFQWLLYIFGGFLVYTGWKLWREKGPDIDPEHNIAVRLAKRFLPVTHEFHDQKFFIVENGKRLATPMLIVLVTVEFSDVLFAVDSIPAIFGITQDPFIIMTSNIFAILGLRALYFLLAGVMDRFHYLQKGLSAVLTFIGVKMLIVYFDVHVPTWLSMVVVFGILVGAIGASLLRKPPDGKEMT